MMHNKEMFVYDVLMHRLVDNNESIVFQARRK